jgi:glycyl-tRNA synthetase beta subunit
VITREEQIRRLQRDVKIAAFLCKADLTTGMVKEFPELQGVYGRILFQEQYPNPTQEDMDNLEKEIDEILEKWHKEKAGKG